MDHKRLKFNPLSWLTHLLFYFCIASFFTTITYADDSSTPQTITIGALTFNPPFETSNTNQNTFYGFEVELITAACQQLNFQCVYKSTPSFQELMNQLEQGQVDLVIASVIIINGYPQYAFSYPFVPSSIQFFAKNDSPIQSIADISKARIGVINDPLIVQTINGSYSKDSPATVYNVIQTGIDDLAAGKIDVFAMQTPSVNYWLSITNNMFKLVGDQIPIGFGNGALSMQGRTALMEQFNQALIVMEKDGTYQRIYEKYGLIGLQ